MRADSLAILRLRNAHAQVQIGHWEHLANHFMGPTSEIGVAWCGVQGGWPWVRWCC